mgnify:CR=1 FL=1
MPVSMYVNKSISPTNKFDVYSGTASVDKKTDFQYGIYPYYNYHKAIKTKVTKTKRNQEFVKSKI